MMIELAEIIKKINPDKIIGNALRKVDNIISILDVDYATDSSLLWLNKKSAEKISQIKKGVIICTQDVLAFKTFESCVYLLVDDPRKAIAIVIKEFFARQQAENKGVEKSAIIYEEVQLGVNVYVGHNTVIEGGCIIGNNVVIGSNNVIKSNTIVEDNVRIGSNNTIGDDGFGYEKDKSGIYSRMPHIGNVHICKNVEISNNVCIDRAVLGSTRIGENSKIDNLVHIAHGVVIGKNTLIIANCMIAGSTVIGDNVWVSPSSALLNKLNVGNNSLIGMGSVVIRDVPQNTVVVGSPAKEIKKNN